VKKRVKKRRSEDVHKAFLALGRGFLSIKNLLRLKKLNDTRSNSRSAKPDLSQDIQYKSGKD
jgi:hypothetical protein